MGLYDRHYTREHLGGTGGPSNMRFGFPPWTPLVKKLIIINAVVFFLGISPQVNRIIFTWFSVDTRSWLSMIQLWRLITYQFVHSGFWHIAMNMLVLYFLGPTLEKFWGSRKFLYFYLGCGVVGGLFYSFLTIVGWLASGVLVGASGAILGLLAACAILFPHFVVFILLFPVPIRVASIVLAVGYLVFVLQKGSNAGGDAAHLAGMAAGACYIWFKPWRDKFMGRFDKPLRENKINSEADLQKEVDRILDKVHEEGIASLTHKEKKILRKATYAEKSR